MRGGGGGKEQLRLEIGGNVKRKKELINVK